MRCFGFLFMLLLIGTTAFVYLGLSSKYSISLNPDMVSIGSANAMTLTMKRRKLKRNMDHPRQDNIDLQDYQPIDPIPSSTNSIRPGPIQHGVPLMPYIPKPSPPPTEEKHEMEKQAYMIFLIGRWIQLYPNNVSECKTSVYFTT